MTTVEEVRRRAEIDAKTHGYHLTPDPILLGDLLDGLRVNEERYGYPSCPCRGASGVFDIDRDIICPCDYRDPDVLEFGACYCALYVDRDVYEGRRKIGPIPERRPQEKLLKAFMVEEEEPSQAGTAVILEAGVGRRLIYCRQCGYVVFREEPPYVCPICRARREMFSEIVLGVEQATA